MSQETYNKDSVDATLSRIETMLSSHISETKEYRKANDAKHDVILQRVNGLEGDKKKLLGIALGAGGLPHVIAKIFGSGAGQ